MTGRRLRLNGYVKRTPSEPDRVISIWGGKHHGPHLWIGTDNGDRWGASMWASLSDRRALRRLAKRILRQLDATKHLARLRGGGRGA